MKFLTENCPCHGLLNRSSHLIRILRIEGHHMLRSMIIKRRLGGLTQTVQFPALRVQRILLADNMRRGDGDSVCIRLRRDICHARTVEGTSSTDEHSRAEQRRSMWVHLGVVYYQRCGQRRALAEAHDGIEGPLFGNDPVGVLESLEDARSGRWTARVVVVEGTFEDAFKF